MNIFKKIFGFHHKDEDVLDSVGKDDVEETSENAIADEDETHAAEEENRSSDDLVEQSSLLDNSAYMSLAEQCCQMHDELDMMEKQVKDAAIIDFITLQKSRIREALVISGATMIDEEKSFNRLRHQPVPPAVIANATPIAETLEAGVEIGDRVMIKAKVRIL